MSMPRIPTRIHGLIDYFVGAGLIAAPELIDFGAGGSASKFTRSMGAAAVAYSLLTDYELGAFKLLPMPAHLCVDCLWTSALALGPWVLRFGRRGTRFWLPHAAVALTAAAVIALSDPTPRKSENRPRPV